MHRFPDGLHHATSQRNPCRSQLKKLVTISLLKDVVESFKGIATEAGFLFHRLINLYQRGGLVQRRKVATKGPSAG
jgi:hypothetical protein